LNLITKIKKLKEFIGFNIPSLEISEEREEEIIDKFTNYTSKLGMESIASIFTAGFIPVSRLFAMTVMFPLAPVLEFFRIDAYDYIAFINNRENLKKILYRLELEEAKKTNAKVDK